MLIKKSLKSTFNKILKPAFYALAALVGFLQTQPAIAQNKPSHNIEVEVDPLAYLLKGYSFHAGVTYGKFRTSVGTYAIQQPGFFTNNDAFSVYSTGYDVKTDYLFNGMKGFHTGLQTTYGKEEIELKTSKERETLWSPSFGYRLGYRMMLGKSDNQYKGIYINPWIAIIYSPNAKSVIKSSQEYQQSTFSFFPAVHVGWRF